MVVCCGLSKVKYRTLRISLIYSIKGTAYVGTGTYLNLLVFRWFFVGFTYLKTIVSYRRHR